MKLLVYTDGGSRGNGSDYAQAAYGVHIVYENGKVLTQFGGYLGNVTNNEAEYQAVISAVNFLKNSSEVINSNVINKIVFLSDSNLIVNQINDKFKVNNLNLKNLRNYILSSIKSISLPYEFTYIPREQNKEADRIVNEILDNQNITLL